MEDSVSAVVSAAAILVYQTVVVVEAVVHGTDGIDRWVTVRILHNDAYKGVIILFGIKVTKGYFWLFRWPVLSADAGIIMVFGIHQHPMLVIECKPSGRRLVDLTVYSLYIR